MISHLPTECLHKIFEEFKNDKKTLHSCLLVSRHWCKNIIDFLWRQPFRFLYTCEKECQCTRKKVIKRQFQAYNLVETYLSCFMFNEELSRQQCEDSKKPTYKRPIFNYIQHLKYIDFEELHSAVIDWIQFAAKKNSKKIISFGGFFSPIWNWIGFPSTSLSYIFSSSTNNDHSIILFKHLATTVLSYKPPRNNDQLNEWVANVICKLLMRNKRNSLKSISFGVEISDLVPKKYRCKHLDVSLIDDDSRLPKSYLTLSTFEGASNCLSNLVEFICTSKQRKQHLLNSLSRLTKNLTKIIINVEYYQYSWLDEDVNNLDILLGEVNGLVNLIQAQNSLSHFEIHKCPIGFEQIILALKKHLNYLKFIRLVDVKIVNYEILNILNDGSRWEIMDLSISENSHTHSTDI